MARDARSQVLIVDDDPKAWDPLIRFLHAVDLDAEIWPAVPDFLSAGRPERPTCLIVNVQSTGPSALDFQQELTASNIVLPIIFVTGCGDIPTSVRAMRNGAIDFLSNPFREQDLFTSIQCALARDRVWCVRQNEVTTLRERFEALTRREREVMTQVLKGHPNKLVACDLGISESTVKAHRGKVMRKMKARSVPDLIRIADKIGLDPLFLES